MWLKKNICFIQDPAINIAELKEIHSEINLTVPEPILLSKLHDGVEVVSLNNKCVGEIPLNLPCGEGEVFCFCICRKMPKRES